MPSERAMLKAEECAQSIGGAVAILGRWKGLDAAMARGKVQEIIAALLDDFAAEEREACAKELECDMEELKRTWARLGITDNTSCPCDFCAAASNLRARAAAIRARKEGGA